MTHPQPAINPPATSAGDPKSDRSRSGSAEPGRLESLAQGVEAALLTSERPIAAARLAEALGESDTSAIHDAVEALNNLYDQTNRSFRIEAVAGGWQIVTLPEFARVVQALNRSRKESTLSPAALETLAIIAYRQPIMRSQIEAIRGVACGEVLRSLTERHLVKIVGRAEELGRPMLYGTGKTFLEVFGLASLKDLPKVEELRIKDDKS